MARGICPAEGVVGVEGGIVGLVKWGKGPVDAAVVCWVGQLSHWRGVVLRVVLL